MGDLFCSDPTVGVADILGNVAGRFSLEVTFRDLKAVVGAGQQQVRRVRARSTPEQSSYSFISSSVSSKA